MHSYDGQDPFTPGVYISGKGYWVVPDVADDSNDRDAATIMVSIEGALDRTNWIAWRMVNGLEGGAYPGDIDWNGEHNFNSQVVFDAYVQFNDEVLFSNALTKFVYWPAFNATQTVKRRAWRIAATTFDGVNDTLPSGYNAFYSTDTVGMRTTPTQLSTRKTIVELLELPGAGALVSVKIKCRGAIPWASGQTNPSFTIVSWAGGTAPTALSSPVSTAHTSGNWTTELESTVTPTTTLTIDKDLHYGILCTHPYASGNDAAAWFYDFEVRCDLTSIPK